MTTHPVATAIDEGRTTLGIELGSTTIKAVLIGPDRRPIAHGSQSWENEFVDRTWTYSLDAVRTGLRSCVARLREDVRARHGATLSQVGALGVSAMMHGYLAFDEEGELLTPFRTWRNTATGEAAEVLSRHLGQNIPHRWSVAHYFQAILNQEPHVSHVHRLTTLAGYVHHELTGEWILGIGDASGMFPVDAATLDYDEGMLRRFDRLAAEHGVTTPLRTLLPEVRVAGATAGHLTPAGVRFLDPDGHLEPGAPTCPPEGDAGTGMVATNAVAPRTGNVSAGTSIFAMVVLEGPLSGPHPEIDLVTTPAGDPVGMVHCNNGASELDAWADVFGQFAHALGHEVEESTVFSTLFRASLEADADAGGLTAFNNLAGEPITGLPEGRPLVLRRPGSELTLANFMRAQLFGAFATLRLGMDVLMKEGVRIDRLFAHGGLFATPGVAQGYLAAALGTPVLVGEVASRGGPWGMALLADFTLRGQGRSLTDHLQAEVFSGSDLQRAEPDAETAAGFEEFLQRYRDALPVQRAAVDHT
ncbi:xylulokinase [Mobilicoccus caccae]|uniref:ATPase n=1 Tax=Mobilicoccus caccae TaxID=1859295 RepID=A0ABQ6INR5_9MICO|nr:FGGY-family carbohydrate kinase [Mobilicoccus caccae]GMA38377.1 ATPase [Mobilicoccus caccae]